MHDEGERVTGFREEYRQQRISPRYRGGLHLAFTSFGALLAVIYALLQVEDASGSELLVVPLAFLLANFVEYRVHRGPMHHRKKPLALLFERHTLEHHRFFTNTHMQLESSRDFAALLFPPVMLGFFLGGIAAPIGALLFLVASANIAWLFVATAVGYFLNYEWLHFAYHQKEDHCLSRLPLMSLLRRLHATHHDPKLMSTANFNITYPIFDLVFRTYRK